MEVKFMRILVMFDMPTKTKKERQEYTKFRKRLIKEGFMMMQFSVYMRICKGITSASNHLSKIETYLPRDGNIRGLILTEKQFDNMKIMLGKPSVNEVKNSPYN